MNRKGINTFRERGSSCILRTEDPNKPVFLGTHKTVTFANCLDLI